MSPHRLWRTLLVAAPLLLISPGAQALRAALIAGNNVGHADDQTLRYAEADAERISLLLQHLAGFASGHTLLLKGGSADDVRRGLTRLSDELRRTPGDHLFVLYFSGHADGQALRLGASSLRFTELKQRLLELPAAVRIAIVDACQSGTLTRIKGGRPALGFDVSAANSPRGLAILAATSDTELAQESDELGGSFFTHHLEAGLRGLADRNRDGHVSLQESFDYASERTLDSTLSTRAGPQHPTFRYDLAGHRDVILTRPKKPGVGYGRIVFDKRGWYFVRRRRGPIVAELMSKGTEQIVVESGQYELHRRDGDSLEIGTARVTSGTSTSVAGMATTRVAFGRAVRKGGAPRSLAYAVSLGGLVRTSLAALGPATGAGAAGRLDGRIASLELRTAVARASSTTYVPSTTWEVGFSLAALRAWDVSVLTLAGGVEAGWSLFSQTIGSEPAKLTNAPWFGPTALVEIPWGRRFHARVDAAMPVYVLSVKSTEGERLEWSPSARVGLGAGGYF